MRFELWKNEGGHYLYHYTEAAYAFEIARDEYFWSVMALFLDQDDGVLVLLGDDPLTPFKEVDEQVFLLRAEEGIGELMAMHSILVGVGRREIGADSWEIASWP